MNVIQLRLAGYIWCECHQLWSLHCCAEKVKK